MPAPVEDALLAQVVAVVCQHCLVCRVDDDKKGFDSSTDVKLSRDFCLLELDMRDYDTLVMEICFVSLVVVAPLYFLIVRSCSY